MKPHFTKSDLPLTGFVRIPIILHFIPVSEATWWRGVKEGRFPSPVKLGPRTTAWRVEEIRNLIKELGDSKSC